MEIMRMSKVRKLAKCADSQVELGGNPIVATCNGVTSRQIFCL